MRLNSLFDILRGWPKEGAIDRCWPVHQTSGVYDSIPIGTVVTPQSDGTVASASTPSSGADSIPVWVVIEGNDDFSGTFLEKVNCLRGDCVLQLDPANYSAGSYAPNTELTFSSGKFAAATTGQQIVAEVLSVNASNSTLEILFHGGTAKKV